jgi:translation machinery-associated protein 16
MAPTKKSPKTAKKDKVFHPESRKAEQLARSQLRKSKLAGQASKRAKLHSLRGKFCPSEKYKPKKKGLTKKGLMRKSSCFFFFFSAADFYGFFFHAIPELNEDEDGDSAGSAVLTLSELHDLIANVWLTRHDAELEAEKVARRKGRPKSTKEQKLEEAKLREAEEYRTGMGEFAILLSLRRFSSSGPFRRCIVWN